LPVQEFFPLLFGDASEAWRDRLIELFRWQLLEIGGHGRIELLDAHGANETHIHGDIAAELQRAPADVILHLDNASLTSEEMQAGLASLAALRASNGSTPKLIGLFVTETGGKGGTTERHGLLQLREALIAHDPLRVLEINPHSAAGVAQSFLSLLARELPNEVRIEVARISRDKTLQAEIASLLVKSTAAICTAVGAQPIPLADLPILTTLQLVMVSGIMYISGRERSMRAATEFIAALGVNVGAGMLFREGARAALKLLPGWGNVICGMIAGAGTYAVGKAAALFFIEGASLKQARRVYLSSRKRRAAVALPEHGGPGAAREEVSSGR
jgi:uncharacterized protein (DUF697 family)